MSRTYRSPIVRRRRPPAVVSDESGFVLILVLPAAMLLLMSALSMVSRSNSAAIASVSESRAQAARMVAESGFNLMMARVNNNNYDTNKTTSENSYLSGQSIDGSPSATYTITYNLLKPDPPLTTVPQCGSGNADLSVSIEGKLTDKGTDYIQNITRKLRVCTPGPGANRLRVRAVIQKES